VLGALLGRLVVVRRLALPPGVRVVAVGGATLGGSGKTPLAIACAAEIAARGERVALVGHAYRAKPSRARVVSADDTLGEVGDEALVAARALAPSRVSVVVAPKRADAIALAAGDADVLVIDGVAQTSPVRASLALLAVDPAEPWGRSAAVVPRGELRAPVEVLRAASDMVVAVGDGGHATVASRGAWVGARLHTWADLAAARVGLVCALARPERVVRFLTQRGIHPRAVVRGRDHGPLSGRALGALGALSTAAARPRPPVDIWLATPKCALHARAALAGGGPPLATIEHALVLPPALKDRLALLCSVP
jgi:tetraacyldisaccharide 4'-kinase